MRVLSWHAHLPGGRPKGLPYSNLEELVGRGLAPAALEVSTPCKARSPGCAAPSHGRTTARVAPTGLQERMQGPETPGGPVCRPYENRETSQDTPSPEPHLSPTHAKGARNKKSFRFPIFVYKSRRRRPPTQSPSEAGLRWRGHSPAGERFGAQTARRAALGAEMEQGSERSFSPLGGNGVERTWRRRSGSGHRRETNQLSHSHLCDDCQTCLIGVPRKWGLGEFSMANKVRPCEFHQRLLVPFPRGKGTRPVGRNPALLLPGQIL